MFNFIKMLHSKYAGLHNDIVNNKPYNVYCSNPMYKNIDKFDQYFLQDDNKYYENSIRRINFDQYSRNGLPLKYPRNSMITDINNVLQYVPAAQQNQYLNYFGLEKTPYDIDGIPNLEADTCNNRILEEIKNILMEYCTKNEVMLSHPEEKEILDTIIKGLPEFTFIIGKKQHQTHSSTLDIHSLKVLQKIIQDRNYQYLDTETQQVLKLSSLVHDFGKKGYVRTPGHAAESSKILSYTLTNHKISPSIKNKTYDLVKNHHWFEGYNTNRLSPSQVSSLFKNDRTRIRAAKIFAKADFESVSPDFHLKHLIPNRYLSQAEFESIYNAKVRTIPETWFENFLLNQRVSSRTPLGKQYPNASMNEVLSDSNKQIFEVCMDSFFNSSKWRTDFRNVNRNIISPDLLLHATSFKNVDKILETGIRAREFCQNYSAGINGRIVDTMTPLCVDVWQVDSPRTIQRYFDANSSHWRNNSGETNFLPNTAHIRGGAVICFNKQAISRNLINNSFLVMDESHPLKRSGFIGGHNYPSHRVVPFGIPANAIERVILDTRNMQNPAQEIANLKQKIHSLNYDILLFDIYGRQL